MAEKISNGTIGYSFGILSIVFAFFAPVAGLIIGIIGLRRSNKANMASGKRLNTVGIILSIILIIASIIFTLYSYNTGLGNFPLY